MELISWPDGLTAEGIKPPAYVSRLRMWLTMWSHYWVPDTAERSTFIISSNPSNNPKEMSFFDARFTKEETEAPRAKVAELVNGRVTACSSVGLSSHY